MKIVKYISLLGCIVMASCSAEPRNLSVNYTDRHYIYSIGTGETIRVGRDMYFIEKYVTDVAGDIISKPYIIDSVILKSGNALKDNDSILVSKSDTTFQFDLDITCLKSFDGTINIDYVKYYFEEDNTYLNMKYNIDLSYNSGYEGGVNFSEKGRCLLLALSNTNTNFLLLNKRRLGLSADDSFVIDSFSLNNSKMELSNKEWAPYAPYTRDDVGVGMKSYYTTCMETKFSSFTPVDIKDYTDLGKTDGVIIKYDLTMGDSYDLVGADIVFNVHLNGDAATVMYHVQLEKYIPLQ